MREKILQMINDYWKFDNQQQPMSSWHDKQDLLKAIEEVLPQANVIKSVCECDYPLGKCEKGKICERCNNVIEW